jgi:YidC/Oxa1 family membrane protein insertase
MHALFLWAQSPSPSPTILEPLHDTAHFFLFEIFAAALTGFYAVVHTFGLSIILLTIAVRVVLLPLSIKQTRSMREMQRIQPEVKKLQAKYKGNRQKLNEEMMKLYKEHSVNPFGGCFPLLAQFPVLIGLFYVIRAPLKYMGYTVPVGTPARASIPPADYLVQKATGIMHTLQQSSLAHDLRDHALAVNHFLGIRLDCSAGAALSKQDPSSLGEVCGSGLVSALPYLILVLAMGYTTYYQQKQMQAKQPASGDSAAAQMQTFAKIMPFFLMFLAYGFPTGVVLYWLTTNIWTIGQQRLMFRIAPPPTTGAKKPGGSPKGSGPASPKPSSGKTPKGAPEKPTGDGPPEDELPETPTQPSPNRKKRRK